MYVDIGTEHTVSNPYIAPKKGMLWFKSGATASNQICSFVVDNHIVNTQHYSANTSQCACIPFPVGAEIYYDTNSNAQLVQAFVLM